MAMKLPIGIDDFRKLREEQLEYVDKSHLIRELIDQEGIEVILFPRPRRFGKTINLSMLRYFFEKSDEDLSHIFQGLSIWQAGDAYRTHFQRYPVIFFSLKGTNGESFERCLSSIRETIIDLYQEHRHLLDGGRLGEVDIRRYRRILDGTAEQTLYDRALLDLSACLHLHHGEKVVILIDEYDEPIHAGYFNGYASKILAFLRVFLGQGLKGNIHLHRAVLTGILRVAKENLFSGLNNVTVYSLLATRFNTCFGFTEPEVAALLERTGRGDKLEAVRTWYNGYVFGGEVAYNPWSVLSYLQRGEESPEPFWVATSSNDLVRELLGKYALRLQPDFEALLRGGSIERVLEENVVLNELAEDEGALWSLLVFSGYLKAEKRSRGPLERALYRLSIPNLEVRLVYASSFRRWMEARIKGEGTGLESLARALLSGDAAGLEVQLQGFAEGMMSYHDGVGPAPEHFYHGFVLGLLVALEPGYRVRSNRESGEGRPDVLIVPAERGKAGVALELKVARSGERTLDKALKQGLKQIRDRDYTAELCVSGAMPIHAFVVAFDGKRVRVRAAGTGPEARRGKGDETKMRKRIKRKVAKGSDS